MGCVPAPVISVPAALVGLVVENLVLQHFAMTHHRGTEDAEGPSIRRSSDILSAAIEVHRQLGPGLLESAYTAALQIEFFDRGVLHECEVPIHGTYLGRPLGVVYRADILVEEKVLIEVKSARALEPVRAAVQRTVGFVSTGSGSPSTGPEAGADSVVATAVVEGTGPAVVARPGGDVTAAVVAGVDAVVCWVGMVLACSGGDEQPARPATMISAARHVCRIAGA